MAAHLFIVSFNLRAIFFLICGSDRQNPKNFIRHRYLLTISIFLLNAILIINSCFPTGFHENAPNIIEIAILALLFYLPISIFEHLGICFCDFQLFLKKTTRISRQQCYLLFLFHFLMGIGCFSLFHFYTNDLKEENLLENFQFTRYACLAINILSIPMNYNFLLAWNSDKLDFIGIHPETKRNWEGVIKRDQNGEWVIDESPQDHELSVV
ncbi:hypothetical protein CRE_24616 [Caenorhabditis remanei]|uniref:Uncharacterized protein n=1 Tax=Caenorhabditis remanei TaxID=31234 RepID=E3MVG4_CAERE|nr:hypothetical protein CRE_24616 [Caenorhabditis remanei]